MTLGRNLIAGLANSIWSALIGLAVVPFYLKYLGVEAYGLIGFFVTTQALLQLLDMGMAPTINREVARCSAAGDLKEAGALLHTLAVVYWVMAAAIAVLILAFGPMLAGYWLQSSQLSPQTVSHAVMLMGLVVACRWPIGLYQGALIGAHRLTVSSAINMAVVTVGSVGAITVLAFVSPTIEAFFIWQACVGLVCAIFMRAAAWRIIGRAELKRFDPDRLRSVWRFTAGMSGIGLTALVFTQLDKVILSKMLGLGEFGHYMLATAVVSGLYVFVSPLFNVIYPRFSALVVAGDVEKLTRLYRLGTRMLATLLFPIAIVLALFAEDLVHVWTGDPVIAESVAPVIALLVIGSALNGVMYFPYALQLAYGMTWIPLTINVVLMCFLVPMIIYLAREYGALGGAMAWMIAEVLYVLLGPWLTHRYILKGLAPKFFLHDVCMPLVLALLIGLTGYCAIQAGGFSHYERVMLAGGLAAFMATLVMVMSGQLREMVWSYARRKRFGIRA
ncbi:lipopolysaccharide biosynthesis protein [Denitromonas sp.]|uniref:lipopolysaccharide biosynthesis protein n=1 Tax=Denitromonas sp. TaxID=2734609 RepID=UPI002AFF433B|nr:oligosaccharide flippase family protein [Denitromonas sp.]